MDEKVVISGVGIVSPIGIGGQAFEKNLFLGKNGVQKITLFDTSQLGRHFAGEIPDFDPFEFISPDRCQTYGRASQFAIASAIMALEDAGLDKKNLKGKRSAIIIGTTMVEARVSDDTCEKLIQNQFQNVERQSLFHMDPACLSANVASHLDLEGFNVTIPNACSAGNFAIAYGLDMIRRGQIDIALVGGTDSLSRVALQGFHRLRSMAPEICQPFDKNRKGMILAEGAGVIVLEPLAQAQNRIQKPFTQVLGYGMSCDASHIVMPSQTGIYNAMDRALNNAKIDPSNVDYICAHGTGTRQNDIKECAAIKKLINTSKNIPISSIKSMMGHSMGAASVIETIACCLALKKQMIPPTINHENMDPLCDIDCVPNEMRYADLKIVLNNSSAFGGNNCTIVLKKNL